MGYFRLVDDSSLITARTVYNELEIIMAIVFILPAFMLLTLAAVAILALDKPPVAHTALPSAAQNFEEEFELAA
jgi:hypothetical protein